VSKYLYLLVFPAILLIFSSCKEEKPVKAPCENGFLDAEETDIDYGIKCTPIEIPLLYVDPRKNGHLLGD
jgi:hypothetical protein